MFIDFHGFSLSFIKFLNWDKLGKVGHFEPIRCAMAALQLHDLKTTARCNDGSTLAFYLRPGSSVWLGARIFLGVWKDFKGF